MGGLTSTFNGQAPRRSARDEVAQAGVRRAAAALKAGGMEFDYTRYVNRPTAFVVEVLGAKPALYRKGHGEGSYQGDILEACATNPRVAWRAAHGTGKTTLMAWLLIWWLLTRPYSRVFIFAPAFERQVGKYLLPEVRKWLRKAPEPLPLIVRNQTVEVVGSEQEWFALAVQASDPDKVEGGHGESVLILADEAKGLSQAVVNAMRGTQTDIGGDRLYFMGSVPGGAEGPFYKVFTDEGSDWVCFHTPAAASRIVSRKWIRDLLKDWGLKSFEYINRVQANFFSQVEGGLFTLHTLERCKALAREKVGGRLQAGLDVAGAGRDSTVATIRSGRDILIQKAFEGDAEGDARGEAAQFFGRYAKRLDYINVDADGLGYYMALHLRDLGLPVRFYKNGAAATDTKRWANARAEHYDYLRDEAEVGRVRGLCEDKTFYQLVQIKYQVNAKGQMVIESKKRSAKEIQGWRSPDWADSTMMAFAPPQGTTGRKLQIS